MPARQPQRASGRRSSASRKSIRSGANALLYPDGGVVDVFARERDGHIAVTDLGEALGWLRLLTVGRPARSPSRWSRRSANPRSAIETAQGIEELIGLAKDMLAASARGEQLGLSKDELAFYDALETNDSAVKVLGEPALQAITRELVATVRKNVTIDWTLRENVRAQIRVLVRRILRKHGQPPDKEEKATRTALEQAEALSAGWAAA
jgi:hypothetical protein